LKKAILAINRNFHHQLGLPLLLARGRERRPLASDIAVGKMLNPSASAAHRRQQRRVTSTQRFHAAIVKTEIDQLRSCAPKLQRRGNASIIIPPCGALL
jgi:hypothetical protein